MKLVALTGGIGCGKTTVLEEFQKLGVPCFVADQVAGRYYDDPAFVAEVVGLFGNEVLRDDGSVDKRAIARIVFNDAQALKNLNVLIHPRVWEDFRLFAERNSESPYVIFESAITYEYGFDKMVDKVICVYLEKEERLRRLELRDKVSRTELEARMRNQWEAEEKMMRADFVILNYEGNPRKRQVAFVHNKLVDMCD